MLVPQNIVFRFYCFYLLRVVYFRCESNREPRERDILTYKWLVMSHDRLTRCHFEKWLGSVGVVVSLVFRLFVSIRNIRRNGMYEVAPYSRTTPFTWHWQHFFPVCQNRWGLHTITYHLERAIHLFSVVVVVSYIRSPNDFCCDCSFSTHICMHAAFIWLTVLWLRLHICNAKCIF